MPTPIPNNVIAAREQVETSDFFALCYLMLCQLAYTDETDGREAAQRIIELLPTLPVPQGQVTGQWSLAWGPAVSGNNSNLMYAAEFSDKVSGLPVFTAVAIRGTDTQAEPSGVIKQVIEDLDAEHQVVFPQNNTAGAKIANGTKIGLDTLTGFRDNSGKSVAEYLTAFQANNPEAPVVVTGHSLGGCQTTVVALDLASKLPVGAKIVPNSFAAPTAGNSAFIQLYEETFAYRPRWFNDIDLVPMAFAGLGGIKRLWNQCQTPAPGILRLLIDVFEFLLAIHHTNYHQQSPVDSRVLAGGCQLGATSAISQNLLDKAVGDIQTLLQDALRKQEEEVRKVPLIGGLVAHGLEFAINDDSFKNIDAWVKELLFQHLIPTGYWNAVKTFQGVAFIPNPFVQAAAAAAGRNGQ